MRWKFYCTMVIALIVVVIAYWPAVHGNFVWDDVPDFVERGWLTHGDAWKHYIFKDFNDWPNYFRPLVVALFTLQVRLFNDAPAPMHVVSIVLHMVNTFLVGLLSWRCGKATGGNFNRKLGFLAASMLIYGLHPVQIEAVAWIGCQFDLVATMFMLTGLLANTLVERGSGRAILVALMFFLAACAKESAASFPLMLAVFDWALLPRNHDRSWRDVVDTFVKRNWQTYLAMLVAGAAYLAFRRWGLGQIVRPVAGGGSSSPLSGLQESCFIYLHYWEMLLWPMHGISPIHEIDTQQFHVLSVGSLLIDVATLGTVVTALLFATKRSSPIGCIVLMMTVGLLPVLHIIPVAFAPSLYHERYAMVSLAGICSMLPLIRTTSLMKNNRAHLTQILIGIVGCFWLIFTIASIRTTIPLWSSNARLWQWALVDNPNSVNAKDSLLTAYLDNKDYIRADRLVDQLRADHVSCTNCMLNAAILAIAENDPARAAIALQQVRHAKEVTTNLRMFHMYLLTTGNMLILQGQLTDAEAVLRAATKLEPLEPQAGLSLATTLALEGKEMEARQIGNDAISMLPTSQQESRRKNFEQIIDANTKSNPSPAPLPVAR